MTKKHIDPSIFHTIILAVLTAICVWLITHVTTHGLPMPGH